MYNAASGAVITVAPAQSSRDHFGISGDSPVICSKDKPTDCIE